VKAIFAQCIRQEAQQAAKPHFLLAQGSFGVAFCSLHVFLVYEDRNAVLAAQPLGETNMIRIAMSEDDSSNVAGGPTQRVEFGDEVLPVTGKTCIHNRDPLWGYNEIDGNDVVADAVKRVAELHNGNRKLPFRNVKPLVET
jgi:hypothetical protein